jgi:hypothetical protein
MDSFLGYGIRTIKLNELITDFTHRDGVQMMSGDKKLPWIHHEDFYFEDEPNAGDNGFHGILTILPRKLKNRFTPNN